MKKLSIFIFLFNTFRYRIKHHVGGTFVNCTDFRISVEFLLWKIGRETNTTHEINTLWGDFSSGFCQVLEYYIIQNNKLDDMTTSISLNNSPDA